VRVFAFGAPADMRKGFDGLYGLVKEHLHADPFSGDLYLFVASNRKRAKVLLWDGTGLCLYAKRLEKGRFAHLWGDPPIELTMAELQLFLEGSGLVGKVERYQSRRSAIMTSTRRAANRRSSASAPASR
jgi:transposase